MIFVWNVVRLIVDGPVFVGPVLYFVASFHRPFWLVGLGQAIAIDPGLGTWPMLTSHSLPPGPWLVGAPGCCLWPPGLLGGSLLVPHGCWSPCGSCSSWFICDLYVAVAPWLPPPWPSGSPWKSGGLLLLRIFEPIPVCPSRCTPILLICRAALPVAMPLA